MMRDKHRVPKIEAAVFDANGTLFNDWQAIMAGNNATFEHFNTTPPTLTQYIHEVATDGSYLNVFRRRGITASHSEIFEIFHPVYKTHLHTLQLMPGVLEALTRLRDANIELHVITAGQQAFIEPLLVQLGIYDFFHGFDYHTDNKTESVLRIVRDRAPRVFCMTGDLSSDVQSAADAGIHALGLHNPDVPRDIFERVSHMDFYALSFEAVAHYILTQHTQ